MDHSLTKLDLYMLPKYTKKLQQFRYTKKEWLLITNFNRKKTNVLTFSTNTVTCLVCCLTGRCSLYSDGFNVFERGTCMLNVVSPDCRKRNQLKVAVHVTDSLKLEPVNEVSKLQQN